MDDFPHPAFGIIAETPYLTGVVADDGRQIGIGVGQIGAVPPGVNLPPQPALAVVEVAGHIARPVFVRERLPPLVVGPFLRRRVGIPCLQHLAQRVEGVAGSEAPDVLRPPFARKGIIAVGLGQHVFLFAEGQRRSIRYSGTRQIAHFVVPIGKVSPRLVLPFDQIACAVIPEVLGMVTGVIGPVVWIRHGFEPTFGRVLPNRPLQGVADDQRIPGNSINIEIGQSSGIAGPFHFAHVVELEIPPIAVPVHDFVDGTTIVYDSVGGYPAVVVEYFGRQAVQPVVIPPYFQTRGIAGPAEAAEGIVLVRGGQFAIAQTGYESSFPVVEVGIRHSSVEGAGQQTERIVGIGHKPPERVGLRRHHVLVGHVGEDLLSGHQRTSHIEKVNTVCGIDVRNRVPVWINHAQESVLSVIGLFPVVAVPIHPVGHASLGVVLVSFLVSVSHGPGQYPPPAPRRGNAVEFDLLLVSAGYILPHQPV